jgi:hypothetical protein
MCGPNGFPTNDHREEKGGKRKKKHMRRKRSTSERKNKRTKKFSPVLTLQMPFFPDLHL